LASSGRNGIGSLAPEGQVPLRCVQSTKGECRACRARKAEENAGEKVVRGKGWYGAYHPCRGSFSPFSCIDSDRIFWARRPLRPLPAGPAQPSGREVSDVQRGLPRDESAAGQKVSAELRPYLRLRRGMR
jgi:hypothetical protein